MRILFTVTLLLYFSFVEAKIYAVVVGVEKYDGTVTDLGASVDDAQNMYNFLRANKNNKVVYLTDTNATKQNILYAMEKTFALAKKDDMIIFFFAGHGAEGMFCPHNVNGGKNALLHTEVKSMFKKSHAKHKLVIADACFSGSIHTKSSSKKNYETNSSKNNENVVIFMSSRDDEYSMEDRYINAGFFTHFLVRGMGGEADGDKNKEVTLYELYAYVRKNVRSKTNEKQTPVMFGNFNKEAVITTY